MYQAVIFILYMYGTVSIVAFLQYYIFSNKISLALEHQMTLSLTRMSTC